MDGRPDFRDLDSDSATNSTVGDHDEAGADPTHPVDTNHDGRPDHLDPDDDGDGILDAVELTPQGQVVAAIKPADAPDSDGDAVPDFATPTRTTSSSTRTARSSRWRSKRSACATAPIPPRARSRKATSSSSSTSEAAHPHVGRRRSGRGRLGGALRHRRRPHRLLRVGRRRLVEHTINLGTIDSTTPQAGESQGTVGGAGFRAGAVPIVVTVRRRLARRARLDRGRRCGERALRLR